MAFFSINPADIRNLLKDELARLFWISFGVFLFVLFFQPFPLAMLDENNRLLYVTGFGAISFILSCIVLIIVPLIGANWFKFNDWETGPSVLHNLILLALTSTAFTFYIRYVGKSYLSFYIIFKIVLVCLLPVIIMRILYKNKTLECRINTLEKQNNDYFIKLHDSEKALIADDVEIVSENKSDRLILRYSNIISIKSADNYVEIFYLQDERIEKRLLRNTLKNIEHQLSVIRYFIRCHRTYLINIVYVEKLVRDYSGYKLKMICFDEKIPVSRQFIVQVKTALESLK